MANDIRLRHIRHRRMDGLNRGSGARKRLARTLNWLERISTKLSGTAASPTYVADNTDNTLRRIGNIHEFVNGQIVRLTATAMPTGLAAATDYYVVVINDDRISLSLIEGGPIVEFSDNGSGIQVFEESTVDALIQLLRAGVTPDIMNSSSDIDTIVYKP